MEETTLKQYIGTKYHGMSLYFDALKARLEILNSESEDK